MTIQSVNQAIQAANLRHLLRPAEQAALDAIRLHRQTPDRPQPTPPASPEVPKPKRLPNEPGSIIDITV